jgi:hypothetical protein
LRRFLVGLGKKIILADNFALLMKLFRESDEPSVLFYWMYAAAFMLNIYFDFSGYSDMAIGLGHLFGFRFLENFEHPYESRSVTEFWRRWHISLSSWFREYVYIPLGGNRKGKARQILNLLIVWGLTGFWHGASWNFLLWGLYYALLLILEKLFLLKWLDKLPRFVGHLYTIFCFMIGWTLFAITDMSQLDFIRGAGKLLIALHIADNDGTSDQHMMPLGRGRVNWWEVMTGLREVGYNRLFNYEIPGERQASPKVRMAKLEYIKAVTEELFSDEFVERGHKVW